MIFILAQPWKITSLVKIFITVGRKVKRQSILLYNRYLEILRCQRVLTPTIVCCHLKGQDSGGGWGGGHSQGTDERGSLAAWIL